MKIITINMNEKSQNILTNVKNEIGINKSIIVNNAIDFYFENYLKDKYPEEMEKIKI